jgi:biopolymer transport protein ExbD
VTSTLSEINVVPLVDVMLVLLIIFMVTAPMIQRGIDVRLPESSRAAQVSGERVYVTVPANYRETRTVYLGEESLRVDALQERVRQAMETAAQKNVYLQGDGRVQLDELMGIIDRLKAAGVETVGIVAAAPTAQR